VDCISYTCYVPGECHGTLIYFMDASNQEECLRECKAETTCEWFSYRSSDNLCLILEDCQLNVTSKEFVSGERACELSAVGTYKLFILARLNDSDPLKIESGLIRVGI
jgi:hypothetical protein